MDVEREYKLFIRILLIKNSSVCVRNLHANLQHKVATQIAINTLDIPDINGCTIKYSCTAYFNHFKCFFSKQYEDKKHLCVDKYINIQI